MNLALSDTPFTLLQLLWPSLLLQLPQLQLQFHILRMMVTTPRKLLMVSPSPVNVFTSVKLSQLEDHAKERDTPLQLPIVLLTSSMSVPRYQ